MVARLVIVFFVSFSAYVAAEDTGISYQIDHYGPASSHPVFYHQNESGIEEGLSHRIWMTDGAGSVYLVDLLLKVNKSDIDMDIGKRNEYWLYTRTNNETAQVLVAGDIDSVLKSNYQRDKPLYVLVHGWRSSGHSSYIPQMTAAILAAVDANVIVVDWSYAADNLYVLSVIYVPLVGRAAGDFLTWLMRRTGGDFDKVFLAGLSLGAHVVGNAGRQAGRMPARIVGLDPAGPLWTYNDHALRSTDGKYVEAIHTNGFFLGIFVPIAGANFYPNSGSRQPGCTTISCPHVRSAELFAASIRFNNFVGKRCKDLTAVSDGTCDGEELKLGNADLTKRGIGNYYLKTTGTWPFQQEN